MSTFRPIMKACHPKNHPRYAFLDDIILLWYVREYWHHLDSAQCWANIDFCQKIWSVQLVSAVHCNFLLAYHLKIYWIYIIFCCCFYRFVICWVFCLHSVSCCIKAFDWSKIDQRLMICVSRLAGTVSAAVCQTLAVLSLLKESHLCSDIFATISCSLWVDHLHNASVWQTVNWCKEAFTASAVLGSYSDTYGSVHRYLLL